MTRIEEFEEISLMINRAVDRAINYRARGEEDTGVEGWFNNLLINRPAWTLITYEGFATLKTEIFRDSEVMDFVMTTSTYFMTYMTLGTGGSYSDFVKNIVNGMMDFSVGEEKNNLVPNEVRDRTFSYTELTDLLTANKWFATVLTMISHSSLIIFNSEKPK